MAGFGSLKKARKRRKHRIELKFFKNPNLCKKAVLETLHAVIISVQRSFWLNYLWTRTDTTLDSVGDSAFTVDKIAQKCFKIFRNFKFFSGTESNRMILKKTFLDNGRNERHCFFFH